MEPVAIGVSAAVVAAMRAQMPGRPAGHVMMLFLVAPSASRLCHRAERKP